MTALIEVKNLIKQYGTHLALDDLSFTVEDNEIFGFLGPNGAGKSTTMNIITGYLAPTSGSVSIDGHDIIEDPIGAKRLIGYLPELPPLYLDMTPREYLKFVAEAKGVKKQDIKAEIDRVMERTAITDVQNQLIKTLSKGYRQRVGMADAIIGSPKVIIMDEPTVGLDPVQIIEFREMIRELGKNHTVIISSHILAEISEICHKIMIIVKGKLVAIDTPENLAKKIGGDYENMSLEDIFLKFVEKEGAGNADSI
jgi:ABC-2 type transport system ATP-binding protein